MKTILVLDVPAEVGGALTILNQYYEKAVQDKTKKWIFITSIPELEDVEHVKNIRFPWVKKSWFHRLYFDRFVAPKLVKRYKIDEVLSLQNVTIPFTRVPQVLYVHQPLPFIDRKFSFNENKKFWVYQNIIGKNIYNSMKKATRVIVQTEWMKRASIKKTGIEESKITLDPPQINIEIKNKFQGTGDNLRTFFYPASGIAYKNHELIVKAAKLLKQRGIQDYRILFTLEGSENLYVENIYNESKTHKLPIDFVGKLDYDSVLLQYSKSVLIFPSYIETFGLPMLEAKLHEAPVLASDMPFSREILGDYSKAKFFISTDEVKLADYMEESIKQSNLLNV